MQDFSRSIRKRLRELADLAYQRELDAVLRELDSSFADWRRGDIDGFQLSDLIHEFHQGPSRQLFGLYSRLKPPALVARAVALRLIERSDTPPEAWSRLERAIEYYEKERDFEEDE